MQGGEGVLNAAQTKDVLPALDDRYTDTRAENTEAPAPKETAQAAESAAVNPHEGIRNDTRAAQTPATTARVIRVKGYGFWNGRYICTQAKHTINKNGYTTTVTGRRILEGY